MQSINHYLENIYSRLEENRILLAVRNGMVLSIPAILTGSFALLLLSIPVDAYQAFLNAWLGGFLAGFLTLVKNATLGIISLIILLAISYSYEQLDSQISYSGVTPFISLYCYIAFTMSGNKQLDMQVFESVWLFHAILVALISAWGFGWLNRNLKIRLKTFTDGADSAFYTTIATIVPAILIIALFALFNQLMFSLLGITDLQGELADAILNLFRKLGKSVGSGLLFIFLMHFMWFLGIHGSNVLDGVAKEFFISTGSAQAAAAHMPAEIMSKTFFDTFCLFGGAGALLCLVIAIFIVDKRKNVRGLTKMAAIPVLFNINELMLFGIPIVLNPVYLVPFLCTPLVLTVLSYLAIQTGLVPHAVRSVEWTTPIFLSGYAATGSIAGSILQLVNLTVGIFIYIPFVKLSQRHYLKSMKQQIGRLTEVVKEGEKTGTQPKLIGRKDRLSSTAKMLAGDLQYAVKSGRLRLFYQPQVNYDGKILGAEALLRWEHPVGGYIYPPLIIMLAEEAGLLDQISDFVMKQAGEDLDKLVKFCPEDFMLSLNITAGQLETPLVYQQIKGLLKKYAFRPGQVGLELTEQTALSASPVIRERMETIRGLGIQMIMDDFGMGHSSVMYLQNSQFDMVKLDGALVRELLANQRCSDIISSILYLAGSLHFQVLAEYVETEEQREALKNLGCENYQGYLFSPAVPFEQLITFLRKRGDME